MASDPNTTALAHVAGALEKTLHVLVAAVLASIVAGVIASILVFGHHLFEPTGSGSGLLLLSVFYALVPGTLGMLLIHGLLRKSRASRVGDLTNYASLAAVVGLLWYLLFSGVFSPVGESRVATLSGVMAVYHAVSGAAGALIFWLLVGRWRKVGKTVETLR